MIDFVVRIISRRTLKEFWEADHPDAEQPLRAWFAMVKVADWSGPTDIKRMFAHASFVGNDRVVFNIGGNKYRLVVKIIYSKKRVYVRFVGTHSEYDRIDVAKV